MILDIDVLKSLLKKPRKDSKRKNIYCFCPWCDHDEFGISLSENHPFRCFRGKKCGETGNIYKLLNHLNRKDLIKGQEKTVDYSETINLFFDYEDEREKTIIDLPTIQKPIGFKRIFSHPYLEKRNFISFNKFEVGITSLDRRLRDYIIILVYQNKELKGYVSRYILKSKKEIDEFNDKSNFRKIRRYLNSFSDFSLMLFGLDELNDNTKTVILVEGIFGKENVDKILKLDDQDLIKCCCSFGAKISDEQILLLKNKGIENIIIFFDPDVVEIIQKRSIEIQYEFESILIALHDLKNDDESFKDPGDLNEYEMQNILDKKNLLNPIDFFISTFTPINLI